jgi:hypothetical protein
MLSYFEEAEYLSIPNHYPVANFCAATFRQLRSNPSITTRVTEIAHYKEEVSSICRGLLRARWLTPKAAA